MDIDMECSSVNMGRNKKNLDSTRNSILLAILDVARVYLEENITMKSLNMEHFMFSDESKFILS